MPIPQVRSIKQYEGSLAVDRSSARLDALLENAREGVLAMLSLGERRAAVNGTIIQFQLNQALSEEQYILSVGEGGASVETGGAAGAVYAAATISQLMLENGGSLPYCLVEDEPTLQWRGFLIDVCRHFFPIETLYRIVDLLAYYKYNRLHLHLSEDQGFRFESERFPLLNSIGSWRKSTLVIHNGVKRQDEQPHGGFYTKAELKELVRYAKARGIEIVPELDMPGHALSIIAAYPKLACFSEQVELATRFGVTDFSKKLFCAGNEESYKFIFALLDEIMEVFPFSYIHIGGDEAVKDDWKRCERCQGVIREHSLKNERELQGYFLNRVIDYLHEHGRRAIVWNDGLCNTLNQNAVSQHWTPWFLEGPRRTVRHINNGGNAIFSPFTRLYYDYPYAMTPLKKTFRYRPMLPGVRKANKKNILGVEAALWTEWVDSEEKLFFNILPRLAATAETGWCKHGGASYRGFLRRLKPHYGLYRILRLPYAAHAERTPPLWRRVKDTLLFATKETHIELLRQKDSEHTTKQNGRRGD